MDRIYEINNMSQMGSSRRALFDFCNNHEMVKWVLVCGYKVFFARFRASYIGNLAVLDW